MKITNIKSILTAPDGIALVVVKVETDQQGLYGLGCATFTQRPTLVAIGTLRRSWHVKHLAAALPSFVDERHR